MLHFDGDNLTTPALLPPSQTNDNTEDRSDSDSDEEQHDDLDHDDDDDDDADDGGAFKPSTTKKTGSGLGYMFRQMAYVCRFETQKYSAVRLHRL